jgi:hypothetical protein
VLIGGHGAAEHRQLRIPVAHLEVSQHLVVGAVLFDDVDHVMDVLAQERHGLAAVLSPDHAGQAVVGQHPPGQPRQLGGRRRGEGEKPGFLALPDIFVGPAAGVVMALVDAEVVAAGVRDRTGVALAVDDEHLTTVRTDGDGGRVPAGGYDAQRARGLQILPQADDRHVVGAAVGYEQPAPIGADRQAVGSRAPAPRQPTDALEAGAEGVQNLSAGAVDHGDPVGIVQGGVEPPGMRREGDRLAQDRRAADDSDGRVGNIQADDLAVALAGNIGAGGRGPDHRAGETAAGGSSLGRIDRAGA